MKKELKPCPFCGSNTATILKNDDLGGATLYSVACGSVDCDMIVHTGQTTREKAIAAWNKRKHKWFT